MSKIIYILIIVVVGLFVYNTYFAPSKVIAGEKAPAFTAENIHGEEVTLADFKGKYVLIDFWGSWCPPCRKEMPDMMDFYNKYKEASFDKANGFEMITIALEKNDASWQKVADQYNFSWRNQIVDKAKFVRLSSLALTFKVTDVPSKFLINPNGEIIASNVPFETIDKIMSTKVSS